MLTTTAFLPVGYPAYDFMNLKKLTYTNFKEGLHKVTPLQLCNSRIAGNIGTIVGVAIGFFSAIYARSWWLMVVMFFVGWLQFTALIGDLQQRKILKESEEQINEAMKQLEKINRGLMKNEM